MMNEYIQAGQTFVPVETLEYLAQQSCARVRARVAENRSTPLSLLQKLSHDRNPEVRMSLALNPQASEEILWNLAQDSHPDVRFSLAENPNTLFIILIWLSADENPYISQRARKTIESVEASKGLPQRGGDLIMSERTLQRKMTKMLRRKERLTRQDAARLRKLVLEDGYLSTAERKVLCYAIENDLLEDAAFEVFLDLILDKTVQQSSQRALA